MKDKEKKFQTDSEYRIYRLRHFGKKYGWKEIVFFNNTIWLQRNNEGLIIDLKELKIKSMLVHPKHGFTTLYRKGDFTQNIIESIFRNPRAHMDREKVKSEYVKG